MNEPEKKERKKTGFYIALYSCVGVILVAAAVIGYNNFANTGMTDSSSRTPGGIASLTTLPPMGDVADVDTRSDESYEEARRTQPPATAEPTAPAGTPAPTQTAAPETPVTQTVIPEDEPTDTTAETSENEPESEQETSQTEEDTPPLVLNSFVPFDEGAVMLWPVQGEIALDYSADHVIYDPTLDQYRTTDSISIASVYGEPVAAAYGGVVDSVYQTREDGICVSTDLGNGWRATYSQLRGDLAVEPGDVVQMGDLIGYVNLPSIYTALLGEHIGFELTRNDASVDPTTYLAAK